MCLLQVSGNGEMQVIDLPDSRPVLVGGQAKGYKVGEWLDVNCTSPNSKPPAQLRWYINSETVSFIRNTYLHAYLFNRSIKY